MRDCDFLQDYDYAQENPGLTWYTVLDAQFLWVPFPLCSFPAAKL